MECKVSGLYIAGLAYGIYNEGLFAKTFFNVKIANTPFIDYGIVWHINLSWAAVMVVFHAFFSFLFPLLIVYNLFPKAAGIPWINKKWWIGVSIACFLYISYKFLENTWPVTPLHFVALVTIMAILILFSRCFKGGLTIAMQKPRLWLIAYGIIFVGTTFTVSDILARSRINIFYFLAFAVINLLVAVMLLDKRYGIRTLLIFSLTAQFGFAASVIFVAVMTKSETGIITGSTFALVFAVSLIALVARTNMEFTKPKQLLP